MLHDICTLKQKCFQFSSNFSVWYCGIPIEILRGKNNHHHHPPDDETGLELLNDLPYDEKSGLEPVFNSIYSVLILPSALGQQWDDKLF